MVLCWCRIMTDFGDASEFPAVVAPLFWGLRFPKVVRAVPAFVEREFGNSSPVETGRQKKHPKQVERSGVRRKR